MNHHQGSLGVASGLSTGRLEFVWLEITGRCQLSCLHCYAESGPNGSHGTMGVDDWKSVIDQCSALGVRMVQFIGGEVTLHPALPELVDHALSRSLEVEVFSNLVHVRRVHWEIFSRPGVVLATSYYSDDHAEQDAITGGRGAARRTLANIAEARRRGIQLRVGLIQVDDNQRVASARQQLVEAGVEPDQIGFDRMRHVGRGQLGMTQSVSQLCGNCTRGVVAVSPSGDVWPCVFSRWLPVGNVRRAFLEQILGGEGYATVRQSLDEEFAGRLAKAGVAGEQELGGCVPNHGPCHPDCFPQCYPRERPYAGTSAPEPYSCIPDCTPSCPPAARGRAGSNAPATVGAQSDAGR